MEQRFGQQLKARRERAGLTQVAAARIAGVGAARWGQIESGREIKGGHHIPANPTRMWVIKAARAVGWSEADALTAAGYDPSVEHDDEPVAEPDTALDPVSELMRIAAGLSPSQQWALALLAGTMADPAAPIPGGAPVRPVAVDCIQVETPDQNKGRQGR